MELYLRIVLIGAGEVGYSVAKNLSADGHNIVIVEENPDRAARINNDLNVQIINGNGARPSVLARAGITEGCSDVPLLIACTNKDEVNIMACWIAKKMGVKHVIARAVGLEFTDNEGWAKDLGIDMLISPERSVAREVEELLQVRSALRATELAGGKAGIYVFRMSARSKACGLPLAQLRKQNPDMMTIVVCIKRGEMSFVPKADDVIEPGDLCYTMCYRSQVNQIEDIFQPEQEGKLRNVFIIGAGKAGCRTARQLHSRWPELTIKLFDIDKAKCERVAMTMPEALVICGDGADAGLLKSEGIENASSIIATTSEDETNLMLAVFGKTLGASRSIAVVRRTNYLDMVSHLPIDAIVNRNQTLAEVIIKNVRYPGTSRVLTVLEEIDAEAIEVTVQPDSPANGKTLAELSMPAGSVVGFIQRGKKLFIPSGSTQVLKGDNVFIFASTEIMPEAMQHFGEASN